jgi:acyl transferase domain-containing protein
MKNRTSFLMTATSFFTTGTSFDASASLQGQQRNSLRVKKKSYKSQKHSYEFFETRMSFDASAGLQGQHKKLVRVEQNSYEFRSISTNRPSCRDSLIERTTIEKSKCPIFVVFSSRSVTQYLSCKLYVVQ